MADSDPTAPRTEEKPTRENQRGGHRGGARPRHQNTSGSRGQHHNSHQRTYRNSYRPTEGTYRTGEFAGEGGHDDQSMHVDNSQQYRGSRGRPFKYHRADHRHKNHHSNHQGNHEVVEDTGDVKPPVSNIQDNFSLLSVIDEKQKMNQNWSGGDQSEKQVRDHERNNYPRSRNDQHSRNDHHYRRSDKQDLSLLTDVEEKQRWSNNNSRTGQYNDRDHNRYYQNEKQEKEGGPDQSERSEQDARNHGKRGRGGYRGNDHSGGQHEQFRWYGRRNYNNFGKQGSYRSYEEPVQEMNQSQYGDEREQRSFPPEERNSLNFNSNSERDHRDHRKYKHQRNKPDNRRYPDLEDDATQRERLMQQLKQGDLECMVCCESVRHRDSVWSCLNCYHIFHLNCIKKWARSPTAIIEGSGWRCPTCQTVKEQVPVQYFCFCGKVRDPERSYHDTPHSCGNVCGRKLADEDCIHPCSLLCHPGPCPPCSALITSTCPCGRVKLQIRCGKSKSLTCDETCGKKLNCQVHECADKCHVGPCKPCATIVKQSCYCTKDNREVVCTETTSKTAHYTCGQPCDRQLTCGHHQCDHLCHDGTCFLCRLLPENVIYCPCSKTKVTDIMGGDNRKSCMDSVPTCDNSCLKMLQCGPEDSRHSCQVWCHLGDCPPCPLQTHMRCRCGATSKDILCSEISDSFQFLCDRRCNKKRRCGNHKCLNTCCVDDEHLCLQICSKKLTCGLHLCQELCHMGNCRPCLNASFEELPCRCGQSVKFPPIPCGARPPECDQLCTRTHPCDHPATHKCHSDEECPPCTVLTEKWCYGGHEKRNHLPCFLSSLSCGLPCQKPLQCGQHKCQRICHQESCQNESSVCLQTCPQKRVDCEHTCSAPCHPGTPCPETFCRKLINVTCLCGIRTEKMPCSENSRLFRQMSASLLASKMQDIQSGASVDISDVLGTQKKNKLNKLECNEECSIVDRNRRLALALQIRNPDLSGKPGPPSYTEFLKEETRKHLTFMKSIHDKLTDIVQLAKQSKQKSRSHSFPPMNRDQRRVVHEMSDYFGCETESFDQEPKRNVVVTAFRDRSYLPSTSVMAVIQREMGQRKVPPPMLRSSRETSAAPKTSSSNKDSIDHFDFPQ